MAATQPTATQPTATPGAEMFPTDSSLQFICTHSVLSAPLRRYNA